MTLRPCSARRSPHQAMANSNPTYSSDAMMMSQGAIMGEAYRAPSSGVRAWPVAVGSFMRSTISTAASADSAARAVL